MSHFPLVDFFILWTLIIPFSTLIAAHPSGGPQTCYYPDGSTSNGTAVERSQTVSTCCEPGFIRLGNGLCAPSSDSQRNYEYSVYRPSCTDSTWNSESCPNVCRGSQDNLSVDQGIVACSQADSYCCARSYDCCANATVIFHLPSSPSSSITTASFTLVTTEASSEGAMSTPASATTPVYEWGPSSTSSSATPSSAAPSSHSSNFPLLGVVLGTVIGVFVIFSLLAAWLLLRRKPTPRGPHQPSRSRPAPLKSILKSRYNPPRLPELANDRLLPGQHDRRSAISQQNPRYQLVLDGRSPTKPDGSPASARTPPAGWPGHEMTPIEVGNDTWRATQYLREMVNRAAQ